MARAAFGLKPGLALAAGVLAAHLAALQWLGSQLPSVSPVLKPMVAPLFTRMLQPAAPAPAVATAAPVAKPPPPPRSVRVVPPARRPASAPDEPAAEADAAPAAAALTERIVDPSTSPSPAGEEGRAEGAPPPAEPTPPVAAAPTAAPTPDPSTGSPPADTWPTDTRLSYRLGGEFRGGPLYGSASVQWQRTGDDYQVRIDIDLSPWATLTMTSQGQVTPEGLQPAAFEETRPGKRRAARFGPTTLALENGSTVPRPPGVQDTASQFVELSHRFATGRDTLAVGRSVSLWMARPGAVDHWTYDVVEREVLRTERFGAIETFHLKPRPIANPRGNVTAEMWFAPSLQYLPVRIKVLMGSEAYVDLLVEKIEQR